MSRTVYNDSKGRRWDRDSIIALLDHSDVFLERALTVVFKNQTDDEQTTGDVSVRNGRGFTGSGESEFMTSLAKQMSQSRRPEGHRLSPRQQEALRRRNVRDVPKMGKYWKQVLIEIEKRDIQ